MRMLMRFMNDRFCAGAKPFLTSCWSIRAGFTPFSRFWNVQWSHSSGIVPRAYSVPGSNLLILTSAFSAALNFASRVECPIASNVSRLSIELSLLWSRVIVTMIRIEESTAGREYPQDHAHIRKCIIMHENTIVSIQWIDDGFYPQQRTSLGYTRSLDAPAWFWTRPRNQIFLRGDTVSFILTW